MLDARDAPGSKATQMDWRRTFPLVIVNALRTATRAIIGVTVVLIVLFVCWFTFEVLTHLKSFLTRTLFGFDW